MFRNRVALILNNHPQQAITQDDLNQCFLKPPFISLRDKICAKVRNSISAFVRSLWSQLAVYHYFFFFTKTEMTDTQIKITFFIRNIFATARLSSEKKKKKKLMRTRDNGVDTEIKTKVCA